MIRTATAALAAFDLPPASLSPIRFTNNAVFEVETGVGRFALRIHRPGYRSLAQIRSELHFLEALQEQLRVPRPVPARDAELVLEVDGRYCDLLTWVDGRVPRPGRDLGPRAAHAIGKALGRIHAAAEAFEPPAGFELPVWDANAMFTEASPFRPGRLDELMSAEDWSLFQRIEERTRATFERLERAGAPRGIIHADFILINCRLRRRGRGWDVGVIDFDDLGWGYFLYDLCPLLDNLADHPGYPGRRRAFLEGYRSVRPLPRAFEAHLPTLMAARHAKACAWAAGVERTAGTGPPAAEHVAVRMELARRWLEPH